MYQYILFDLDGTISDPKVGICTSVQQSLKKMGIDVPDINTLIPFIGPPLRDSYKDFYGLTGEDIEICIRNYRERYSTIGLFENDLYAGMDDCLKELKAQGKVLLVASSKPRVYVEKILDHFGVSKYFDIIMGSELNGTREKKIEVIEECLRLLNERGSFDKALCVMVGDRKYDVEAAKEAGLKNIGVSYGYGSIEELNIAGADIIVGSVGDLKKCLLS